MIAKLQSLEAKQIEKLSNAETEMWKMVENSKYTDEIKIYLETYPNGLYTKQAKFRLWELAHNDLVSLKSYFNNQPNGQYQQQAVEKIWLLVAASNNIDQIKQFTKNHPESPYKFEAEKKIWDLMKVSKDLNEWKQFVIDFPNSRYRGIAKLKIVRFQKKAQKTVTDKNTGSMWQKYGDTAMIWNAAISYCDNLSLNNHNDWRLPNRIELKSAYLLKEELVNASKFYWSSSEYKNGNSNAWYVDFSSGKEDFKSKDYGYRVRCIRDSN